MQHIDTRHGKPTYTDHLVVAAPAIALAIVLMSQGLGAGLVDALTWVWRDALGLPAIAPKTPFVLLHLTGFALGAGGALLLDLFTAWRLRDAGRLTADEVRLCRAGARAVGAGLALLWLSGIAFLVLYAANQPQALDNPKLWAKITVVSVLTVNGMFLHRRVFASMEEGRGWTPQGDLLRRYSILVAVSVASWVTATLLGTVKELNGVAPYATLLGLYGLAIAAAVALVEALRLRFLPPQRVHRL